MGALFAQCQSVGVGRDHDDSLDTDLACAANGHVQGTVERKRRMSFPLGEEEAVAPVVGDPSFGDEVSVAEYLGEGRFGALSECFHGGQGYHLLKPFANGGAREP